MQKLTQPALTSFYLCVYVHVYIPVNKGTSRSQERASKPLELEFPAFVVTQCSDSIPQDRAAGALNQQATLQSQTVYPLIMWLSM